MIPIILYLLIIGYGLFIIGFIYKINVLKMLSSFFLLILGVSLISNGVYGVNDFLINSFAIITIGLGGWSLIENMYYAFPDLRRVEEENEQ